VKLRNSLFIIVLAVMLLGATGNANAQKEKYGQCIGANPLGLVFGQLNVTYEQQLSKTNSFTVSGYYMSISDWSAFGFGGSYRWYISPFKDGKKIIEGFSFGPLLAIGFWNYDGAYDYPDGNNGGTSIALGCEAAYKWVWGGFYLEPMLNIQFSLMKPDHYGTYDMFHLGANIGYAW
jgi:hypothetical protein